MAKAAAVGKPGLVAGLPLSGSGALRQTPLSSLAPLNLAVAPGVAGKVEAGQVLAAAPQGQAVAPKVSDISAQTAPAMPKAVSVREAGPLEVLNYAAERVAGLAQPSALGDESGPAVMKQVFDGEAKGLSAPISAAGLAGSYMDRGPGLAPYTEDEQRARPAASVGSYGRVSRMPEKPEGKIRSAWESFKRLAKMTAARVIIAGVIGATTAGAFSFNHESDRDSYIPVGFSEITQIEKDAARAGREIGPLTRYYTSTNDLAMNIFSAWNDSKSTPLTRNDIHSFAKELDMKMDPTFRVHHYEIPDFVKKLPGEANQALEQLKPFSKVQQEMAGINDLFARTWDESHRDETRTEEYEVEVDVDDGNGKSHKEKEKRTRDVYDHTDHSYDYHKAQGEKASADLDRTIKENEGALAVKEKMPVASKTNAEGEYAAELSRKGQRFDQKGYDRIARSWNSGATLTQNQNTIASLWDALHKDADAWRSAKQTAHDESYQTSSHSDSGPREYQVANKALEDGQALHSSISEVLGGMEYTRKMTPVLEAKIKQLIAIELDMSQKGNAKKVAKEIRQIAKEMYSLNFKGGFNVYKFRAWMVVLSVMGGAVGAGGVAAGIDYLLKRKELS